MSTPALRHFMERALGVHAPELESAFPGCFDWQQLCADAPAMVEQAGGSSDGSERTWSMAIRRWADEMFRASHVATLAVLAASSEDEDPEAALDHFQTAPDDDEEDRFEHYLNTTLGPIESSLGGEDVKLDGRGEIGRAFFEEAWPQIEPVLADVEARVLEDEDVAGEEVLTVLVALARVASILAVLRWMAAFPDAD